jgi:hypothetical protein
LTGQECDSLWNDLKVSDLLVAATWAEEFGVARVARIAAAMVAGVGEVGRPDFDDSPLIIEALGLIASIQSGPSIVLRRT